MLGLSPEAAAGLTGRSLGYHNMSDTLWELKDDSSEEV